MGMLRSVVFETVVGLIVLAITTALLTLWGKRSAGWQGPELMYRGLITLAACLVILVCSLSLLSWVQPKPEVKTTIHQWLERTRYRIGREIMDNHAFHLMVDTPDKQTVEIYQKKQSEDQESAPVYINTNVEIEAGIQEDMKKIRPEEQDMIINGLRMALRTLGVGFAPFGLPLQKVTLQDAFIIDHTMTERELVERIFHLTLASGLVPEFLNQEIAKRLCNACQSSAPNAAWPPREGPLYIVSWGSGQAPYSMAATINTSLLTLKKKEYYLLLLSRWHDNTVDQFADTGIQKSTSFPITGEQATIEITPSPQFTASPHLLLDIYLLLVPQNVPSSDIVNIRGALDRGGFLLASRSTTTEPIK